MNKTLPDIEIVKKNPKILSSPRSAEINTPNVWTAQIDVASGQSRFYPVETIALGALRSGELL